MRPRFTSPGVLALIALAALLPGTARAKTVTSSYTSPNLSITVTTNGSETYDRIDVPCKNGDAVGDFTVAAPWAVSTVFVDGSGNHWVRLTRSPSTDITEKVTLTGPANRGAEGTIYASNGGADKSGGGGPTMLSVYGLPAIGPIGLGILLALMLAAGVVFVVRRRSALTSI
jgi:hypothetical protein